MSRDCEVVVVGGGIAGLLAAYRLRSRDVLLLEASDRVGGRLKSVRRGDYWLNLGGHLLGGHEGPMGRLATELGLPLVLSPGSVTAVAMNGRVLRSSRPELMPFRLPLSPPLVSPSSGRGSASSSRIGRPNAGTTPVCEARSMTWRSIPHRLGSTGRRTPTSWARCTRTSPP